MDADPKTLELDKDAPRRSMQRLVLPLRVLVGCEYSGVVRDAFIARGHEAISCDMESFAIAQACKEAQVRFLAVRVISDTLNDRLPPELTALMKQQTLAGKLGAATGAVFKRPSSVKDMWKLRATATKASETLATFLAGLIPQLNIKKG